MNDPLRASAKRILVPIADFSSRVAGTDSLKRFVERYLADDRRAAAVVAEAGLGKSTTAIRIASEIVRQRRTRFALLLCGHRTLQHQFIRVAAESGLHLLDNLSGLTSHSCAGVCLSASQLTESASLEIVKFGMESSLFVVVDQIDDLGAETQALVLQILDGNRDSRLLALRSKYQRHSAQLQDRESEWDEVLDVEYMFERSSSTMPELVLQTAVITGEKTDEGRLIRAVTEPWFEIIKKMVGDPAAIYQIDPRKWEEIIAGAYKQAGFDEVILTPASGDRGRDVIATKNGLGSVRVIDQVKAYKPGHLVTANEVRALMGVLHADGASKGFVTTTSGFAPWLPTDPLIAPLIPSRLELIDGTRLLRRLKELAIGLPTPCR